MGEIHLAHVVAHLLAESSARNLVLVLSLSLVYLAIPMGLTTEKSVEASTVEHQAEVLEASAYQEQMEARELAP